MYIYRQTHTQTDIHTYTHTHTHVYVHTHIHTCTFNLILIKFLMSTLVFLACFLTLHNCYKKLIFTSIFNSKLLHRFSVYKTPDMYVVNLVYEICTIHKYVHMLQLYCNASFDACCAFVLDSKVQAWIQKVSQLVYKNPKSIKAVHCCKYLLMYYCTYVSGLLV